MAKKNLDFTNPLFNQGEEPTEKRPSGRPRLEGIIRNEEGGNSTQEGLRPEYTRFSVICKISNVKDLRNYAYTKRLSLKDAFDEVLEAFFCGYKNDPNNEELLEDPKYKV